MLKAYEVVGEDEGGGAGVMLCFRVSLMKLKIFCVCADWIVRMMMGCCFKQMNNGVRLFLINGME